MTDHADRPDDFKDLVDALCNGAISDEQFSQLDRLLQTDDDALRRYVESLDLEAELNLLSQPQKTDLDTWRLQAEAEARSENSEVAAAQTPAGNRPTFSTSSEPGIFGNVWQATTNYYDEHPVAFSYLVASVLFVIVGLTATQIYISRYFGRQSEQGIVRGGTQENTTLDPVPIQSLSPSEKKASVYVARIICHEDCRWQTPKKMLPGDRIAIDDVLSLKSGLLELAYDTGACVILQGPCSYRVDSDRGGFLTVGKLTARVEKRGRGGDLETRRHELVASGQWSVASEGTGKASGTLTTSHQSLATSLFRVRTPSATVTDLGTEFGVEVNAKGLTRSHCFQGEIVVVALVNGQISGIGEKLRRGQSAKIEQSEDNSSLQGDTRRVVLLAAKDAAVQKIADNYVRTMPPSAESEKSISKINVLAHYRLGEDDANATAGSVAAEVSWAIGHRDGMNRHGQPRYTSATAAPGSRLAVEFDGKNDWYSLRYPLNAETNNYGIEAWVRPDGVAGTGVIAWNGDAGWGLVQKGGVLCGHINSLGDVGRFQFKPGCWYHVALINERDKAVLYVNGQLAGEPRDTNSVRAATPFGRFWIGSGGHNAELPFRGAVDEVRVFEFKPGDFRVEDLLFDKQQTKGKQQKTPIVETVGQIPRT